MIYCQEMMLIKLKLGKWGKKHSPTELWCSICPWWIESDQSTLQFSSDQSKFQKVQGTLKYGKPINTNY